jgi:hypothetical protein
MKDLASRIQPILNGTSKTTKPAYNNHPTIFHCIMNSSLPPPKKTDLEPLQQEAFSILGAAMETTNWAYPSRPTTSSPTQRFPTR